MNLVKNDQKPRWWQGKRGEWYVVAQFFLILLLFLGPRGTSSIAVWPERYERAAYLAGGALCLAGFVLAVVAALTLGNNLTPLPRPKEEGTLRQTGPYALVRHPIYSGVIQMAYGWGIIAMSWLTILYATLLFLFFDVKSRREERWLCEQYPEYERYRQRVRKLIPFLY